MFWEKLGRIYDPKPVHNKLVSHAANPLPVHLREDIFRVFYSGRDRENRSSVGFVDVDVVSREVVYVHDRPVFQHGPEGSYFSHGVSIGNCYEAGGQTHMLFMGWQSPPSGHWRGDVGRLVLNDDLSLTLPQSEPFMRSDSEDPISLSYPWVQKLGDDRFLMWYGSTVTWNSGNGEMVHAIKSAKSSDGLAWEKTGLAIPYVLDKAQAFSRPTVLIDDNGAYRMWFSYRSGTGQTYRIGSAFSPDGNSWQLDLEGSGIDVSEEGWDSEMIEYPFVFKHRSSTYILYNGNGYGLSGFGLAELRDAPPDL